LITGGAGLCLNQMIIFCRQYQKTAIRACVLKRNRHQSLD
jgi:hypothetical protein